MLRRLILPAEGWVAYGLLKWFKHFLQSLQPPSTSSTSIAHSQPKQSQIILHRVFGVKLP